MSAEHLTCPDFVGKATKHLANGRVKQVDLTVANGKFFGRLGEEKAVRDDI